jgi:phosphatidylinositol alpha-1,6-mannosyltransferase
MDVEGLGMVFLEASACGLPVVAGDSGGAPEAVVPGQTGFVVDGRDQNQLAERLITLLTDAALRERLGKAGRAWVERDWKWQTVAQRLTDYLA